MYSTICESDSRSYDQFPNGARDQNFSRARPFLGSRGNVHCHSFNLTILQLAIPRMDSDPHVKVESLDHGTYAASARDSFAG